MIGMKPLETPRLQLGRLTPEDAPALLKIQNTDFVLRYNGMDAWDEAQMRGWIEKKGERQFALRKKTDGALIGVVGLDEDSLRYETGSVEINYYLAEEAANQGYMTEALTAILAYLFTACGVSLVAARSFAPNTASRRLLLRLGFREEGLLRRAVKGYGGVIYDDALYSITKEEFETNAHA